MARNRYGWQKRAKELARKQKNDDKMLRRQGKTPTLTAEERPRVASETQLMVSAITSLLQEAPAGRIVGTDKEKI